jgi:7,8-dihydropterin-6-yl-methyl-4-(beta-D-ribofuranosyl)aminobenzene 5'-phosphate synthase
LSAAGNIGRRIFCGYCKTAAIIFKYMKITVLIDNKPGTGQALHSEHGLSFWIETGGINILLDTGASGLYAENAARLGIDISQASYLVLSHAHADHTGGLANFLDINSKATVVLSENTRNCYCYSYKTGIKRNISMEHNHLHGINGRLKYISSSFNIAPGIACLGNLQGVYPGPKGNRLLSSEINGKEGPDSLVAGNCLN